MSVLKKLSYLLAAGMAAATLSGAVFAADEMSTEAIAERIAPVGQVYTAKDLEGIATAAAAPKAVPAYPPSSPGTRPPGNHALPRGSRPCASMPSKASPAKLA